MTREICLLLRGATCHQLPRLEGLDPLVQEMHVVVTCIRIEEPVRLNFELRELRAVTSAVIRLEISRQYTVGRMMRHKPKPRGEHEAPERAGSRKKDAA